MSVSRAGHDVPTRPLVDGSQRLEALQTGDSNTEPELLAESVARELIRYIVAARLSLGSPLPSEAALAARFRLSTRVIREALRLLRDQGIVRTKQGRKAEVSDWRPSAIHKYFEFAGYRSDKVAFQLLELRIALEPAAAALAAARADRTDVDAMRQAVERMKLNENQVVAFVEADMAFHNAVVRAAKNEFFALMSDALGEALYKERLAGAQGRIGQGRSASRTLRDHSEIANAISKRDAELAEQRMRRHLQQSLTYYWGHPGRPDVGKAPRVASSKGDR